MIKSESLKNIVVFGGCSVDYVYNQKTDGTYDSVPSKVTFGGKASNQVVACSRAGGKVSIISRLGGKGLREKEIAQEIIKNLKSNKVDVSNIEIDDNVVNDISRIKILSNGENDIFRNTGAIDSFTVDMITKYKNEFKAADFVIAQAKVPQEVTKALINFCYNNKIFLILTPCRPLKLRFENEFIEKINLITCNYEECCKLFGNFKKDIKGKEIYCLTESEMVNALKKYPNKLIVTLGEDGVIYFDGKKVVKMSAIKVENVVDSTGAGDTLNGNLVASLAEGKDLKTSIKDGILASTYKIQFSGAQPGMPTKKQREKFRVI